MSFLHVESFEFGYMLAGIVRLIEVDKVLKPSFERQLTALQERVEQLQQDIISSRISDRSAFLFLVRELFSELSQIRNSYETEQ
jgi:hypothetical protein